MTEPPLKGFISYAHAGHAVVEKIRQQLAAMARAFTRPIELWDDGGLEAGEDWYATILPRIETADLIIVMVSPAALASDYIMHTGRRQRMAGGGRRPPRHAGRFVDR
jgi:hypothetical protein